jgi:hypothetical protein
MPTPQTNIFPFKGLNITAGYDKMPEGMTDQVLNVRPHDTLEGRLRGGRRGGLSKWVGADINGTNPIQSMIRLVRPADYPVPSDDLLILPDNSGGAGGIIRANANRVLFQQEWDGIGPQELEAGDYDGRFYYVGGDRATITGVDGGGSNILWKIDPSFETVASSIAGVWDAAGTSQRLTGLVYDESRHVIFVSVYTRTATYDGTTGSTANLFCLDADTFAIVWVRDLQTPTTDGTLSHLFQLRLDPFGNLFIFANVNTLFQDYDLTLFKINGDTGATMASHHFGEDMTFADTEATDFGNRADIAIRPTDGRVVAAVFVQPAGSLTGILWVWDNDLVLQQQLIPADFAPDLTGDINTVAWVPESQHVVFAARPLADAGGTTKIIRSDQTGIIQWTTLISTQSDADYRVRADHNLRNIFVTGMESTTWVGSSGATANFWVLDLDGVIVADLDLDYDFSNVANDAVQLQVLSGASSPILPRRSALVVISNGNVKIIEDGTIHLPTNGTNVATTNPFRVQMATLNDKAFWVDGTNSRYYDIDDDTVYDWEDETLQGTFPAGNTLVARYRNRIVLAGDASGNWYMCRAGNPLDWDFSPDPPDATQAVAGNNGNGGVIGDLITALIPIGDDTLIFGCMNSIHQMTGDPAAGGQVDLITGGMGIVFGKGWAQDQSGTIYFVTRDGVYTMSIGHAPKSITAGRLDELFRETDFSTTRTLAEWDYKNKQLWVLLSPANLGSQATVLLWDARTDSWWKDNYPVSIGPFFLYADIGDNPNENEFLVGSRDGFIRKVDLDAADDDGNTISSLVRIPLVNHPDPSEQLKLTEVTGLLANGSGPVVMKVFSGETSEQVSKASSPRLSRVWSAGRNLQVHQKVSAHAIALEISQDDADADAWALERLATNMSESGRARKRVS